MFKQFMQWLETQRINRSRAKAAKMIVAVAKNRRITDIKVTGVRSDRRGCGFCVEEVAASFARANNLIWPSRHGTALPVDANDRMSTFGYRGDCATVVCNKK